MIESELVKVYQIVKKYQEGERDFSGINLNENNLSRIKANLIQSDWVGADLSGATLTGAKLYNVHRFSLKAEDLKCEWIDLSPHFDDLSSRQTDADLTLNSRQSNLPDFKEVIDFIESFDYLSN